MKRKFLTLIAAVAAAMALALSAGAEAATPETAGSLTPLMPMFDTADTGIAEYSGDIVQEDAATYDASYNTNEDVAANERDVYNYLTGTMGMNSAAASGVMASMYRESRFYVDITNDYGTAYGLCLGAKEAEAGNISVRDRKGETTTQELDAFINNIVTEIKERRYN